MSYVRKTEISGNLIKLIYFFTYTILTMYLVALGTIKFGMDSDHYVNNSVIRASFYPSFLDLYTFFFGNSFRFLIFIKILFAIFSIHYFLNFLKKKFNLSEPLVYLFTIILLTPYFFGDYKFANRIFTESICYPLYLVSLVFIFRFLFEKKLKFFLYFLFTLSILILTRRQFFFMYPLIIIVISYSHFFLKENKKTLTLILCFLSTVFFTEVVERSYRFIKFDEFKPPPFVGIQLIAAPLYLSEMADLSLFNDPEEKQILREVLNEMSSRKINFVNSRNTQYENYYQHFSANYNKITWDILYKKMKDNILNYIFLVSKKC